MSRALFRLHRRGGFARFMAGVFAIALVASACGGDDGDDSGAAPGASTTVAASETTAAPQEPVVGGEATILLYNEVPNLDPHKLQASGGVGGQRMYALYGALVTYSAEKNEAESAMAESFEPNADFTVWTVKIRPGITFSDGTPYDAAAVKASWTRIGTPATGSPGILLVLGFKSIDIVDPLTLSITLASPNAHLDKSIAGGNANFIVSPKAITDGVDLSSTAVGAGPFLLDSWTRDDQMVFVRNPDYYDAPRPYLDKLTFRVVVDDQQRQDTFTSDDSVDGALLSGRPALEKAADDKGDGAYFVGQIANDSPAMAFNNAAPPFDDVRVRRAVVMAVDHKALAEIAYGDGAEPADNFTTPDSPWHSDKGKFPEYDPQAAQALFDEVAAEKGGPITFSILGSQTGTARTEFIQTSLNQYKNVKVEHQVFDLVTGLNKVLKGDYQMATWGFPFVDPEPGLYNYANSKQITDFSKYKNTEVDALLDQARATADFDTRYGLYEQVFALMAEDVPWWPYYHLETGFTMSSGLKDAQLFGDGTLFTDRIWKAA